MPRAFGEPLGAAMFRTEPEDFQVDEIIDLQPSGEGEHLLLHIRKRDQNTTWVAGLLATLAGINRNDVSYCGMKDRFAVTTQGTVCICRAESWMLASYSTMILRLLPSADIIKNCVVVCIGAISSIFCCATSGSTLY